MKAQQRGAFWGLLWLLLALATWRPATAGEWPAPVILLERASAVSLDGRSLYWVDQRARSQSDIQTIEAEAASLPWAVRERGQQYDIDGRTLWVHFEAEVRTGNTPWFLEIAASGVDRAVLYHRDARGQWVSQEAGNSRAVSDWPLPGRFPTFQLAPSTGQPAPYWLRIEHDRVHFAAPLNLHSQATLAESREMEQFLLGAYFGLLLLIAAVSIANAIAHRDSYFAAYALYLLALAAWQAAYLGVGAQFLWNNWLEWNQVATFLLPGLSSVAGLLFVRTVTEPARFSATLDRLVIAVLLLQLGMVAADHLLATRGTYTGMMFINLLILALIVLLIGQVWLRGDDPHARLIALGFLPVLVMALFPLARALNLMPGGLLTHYGLSIGSALAAPILFYALSLRSDRRREAQVRARALASTDPLTGLTHSRILLLRLESALLRARQQPQPCAVLGIWVANQGAIAAEHGREIAERALVLAASRLRAAVSDIDVASRVGEHQFAILLEGPVTQEQAQSCATRLVASGLRASDVLPGGVSPRFHVAVALLPPASDALTALEILQRVMAAAGELQFDSRRAIRTLNL